MSDGKLSGTKAFVHEAHGADLFVVAAKDGLYLVEKGDGVALTTRKLTDQRSHADVTFDGAAADKLASGGDSLLDDEFDLDDDSAIIGEVASEAGLESSENTLE